MELVTDCVVLQAFKSIPLTAPRRLPTSVGTLTVRTRAYEVRLVVPSHGSGASWLLAEKLCPLNRTMMATDAQVARPEIAKAEETRSASGPAPVAASRFASVQRGCIEARRSQAGPCGCSL